MARDPILCAIESVFGGDELALASFAWHGPPVNPELIDARPLTLHCCLAPPPSQSHTEAVHPVLVGREKRGIAGEAHSAGAAAGRGRTGRWQAVRGVH